MHKLNIENAPSQGLLGLFDDAFVCGFAVHSIRSILGERARYTLPHLAPEECSRAESLFLELTAKPAEGDAYLVAKVEEILNRLSPMIQSGIFARLDRNARFLIEILSDRRRPCDDHQYARGALHYLVQEDDVIPDTMGLLGYLDDYFISELAIGFICPQRTPWLDLIDSVVASWPFLNIAAISDSLGSAPLSEFMRINAALVCASVRDPDGPSLTYLVVPSVGPIPLVLGFFAALGNINEQRKNGGQRMPFFAGQRVRMDNDAVRIFGGFSEDRSTFHLIKERVERGQVLQTIEAPLPSTELYRLVPEEAGRKTAGKVVRNASDEKIGPLDWLFTSEHSVLTLECREKVVIVAPIQETKLLAESTSICGRPLIDAIPFAHRKVDGAWERWSNLFGIARPMATGVSP